MKARCSWRLLQAFKEGEEIAINCTQSAIENSVPIKSPPDCIEKPTTRSWRNNHERKPHAGEKNRASNPQANPATVHTDDIDRDIHEELRAGVNCWLG